MRHELMQEVVVTNFEAAFALGDLGKVDELLGSLERERPSGVPPHLQAQSARFRARRAWLMGDAALVEPGFKAAAGMFREIGLPFPLAETLIEHGEWLVQQGRPTDAEPLLREAREIFERLKAKPWLDRLSKSESALAASRA